MKKIISEAIDKIGLLKATGRSLIDAKAAYEELRKDSTCDKHGIGFCLDDRFSAVKVVLTLDSWRGYYGNSSCSRFLYVDEAVFKKHLIRVLNDELFSLLQKVGQSAMDEARTLSLDAHAELEKIKAELEP